jgi:glutaredoxin
MSTVKLYTKPDCCLCEEALEVIEQVRREQPFELEKIDISVHDELARRYGERIPVVAVNGVDAFEFHVDAERLKELVA